RVETAHRAGDLPGVVAAGDVDGGLVERRAGRLGGEGQHPEDAPPVAPADRLRRRQRRVGPGQPPQLRLQLVRPPAARGAVGAAIGAVVDGCPPRLARSEADLQPERDRRAPGQSALVTQRKESDTVRIMSGVFEGRTLGTPISLLIPNEDMRPGDYDEVREKY